MEKFIKSTTELQSHRPRAWSWKKLLTYDEKSFSNVTDLSIRSCCFVKKDCVYLKNFLTKRRFPKLMRLDLSANPIETRNLTKYLQISGFPDIVVISGFET